MTDNRFSWEMVEPHILRWYGREMRMDKCRYAYKIHMPVLYLVYQDEEQVVTDE